jgi:hypothetical protein
MESFTVSVPDGDAKENRPRFRIPSLHATKQTLQQQQQQRLSPRDVSNANYGGALGEVLIGKGDCQSNRVSSKDDGMTMDAVDSILPRPIPPPAKNFAAVRVLRKAAACSLVVVVK